MTGDDSGDLAGSVGSFVDRILNSFAESLELYVGSGTLREVFKRFQSRKSLETNVVTATQAPPPRPASGAGALPEPQEVGDDFDFAAVPPFTIMDIRAAIPKQCFEKSIWRSLRYVLRDVVVVAALAAGAAYVDSWYVWPLYWFAQGTMFWALFVIGHDCGHGSFSDSKTLNNLVGHLTHSAILVPYHGWRISHRTHHGNHGHVENDESWTPMTESLLKKLDALETLGRFKLPFVLTAYPFYLWAGTPGKSSQTGKTGSHYDPNNSLVQPSERKMVLISAASWNAVVAILVGLSIVFGPVWMFKLYFMPYWTSVMWLDAVTYLHHHGYDKKMPWYRGKEWNFMRGGLSTIDRDYGIFNSIHHDIGTHVIHHLFPAIPHYNLREATKAAKPVLGKYYREPAKSPGPLPLHLISTLVKSLNEDHYVDDEGDVVFYKSLNGKK